MPNLYKRRDSRYWWTWGRYADGERWQVSTGCSDRRAAHQRAIELERERAGIRAAVGALTVTQAYDLVIEARQREGKAHGTLAVYARAAEHCCRIWGAATDVHALTLADHERYLDVRLAAGAQRSTVAIELSKWRAALTHAQRHGLYHGSVAAVWPRAALRGAHRPRERYLTREEYARLHAELERRAGRGDWLAGYVYTGARRAELWRVRPEDVDLTRGTLRIRGTKTSGADRTIPVAPALLEVLRRRLDATPPGRPLWPTWHYTRVMQHATAALGMPPVVANDLRRTFCSWLAQAGVPEGVCARLMGHGSTRMVRSVYARFGADDLAAAVARL